MPLLLAVSPKPRTLCTEYYDARQSQDYRLRHAVSAVELRITRKSGFEYPVIIGCRGSQQALRAIHSFPLRSISLNSLKSTTSSYGEKRSTQLYPSAQKELRCQAPHSQQSNHCEGYPSPPEAGLDEFSLRSRKATSSEGSSYPLFDAFPLAAKKPATALDPRAFQTPKRKSTSVNPNRIAPSPSPDRYTSSRFLPQEPSSSFRLSKSPHRLSPSEKLIRSNSASPDPFGSLLVPRLRNPANITRPTNDVQSLRSRSRIAGTANVLSLPQDALALQVRQASAGAIWNVGGNSQMAYAGPIRSISNGRGGFVSSGSNAPLYTSQFFDSDTLDQDMEQFEGRLAAALEIDQTSRVLQFTKPIAPARSVSTGVIGTKRKNLYVQPRTRWMNGEWTPEGSNSRESLSQVLGSLVTCANVK